MVDAQQKRLISAVYIFPLCFGRWGGAAEAGQHAPEAEAAGAADGDAGGRGRQSQQQH